MLCSNYKSRFAFIYIILVLDNFKNEDFLANTTNFNIKKVNTDYSHLSSAYFLRNFHSCFPSLLVVFHLSYQMNHMRNQALFFYFLIVSFNIALSLHVNSSNKCILEFRISSSGIDSNCMNGLLNNCCGLNFKEYLQSLARRTNQTGQIFLNATEQYDCLSSMNSNGKNDYRCGIEKLTRGEGGCSDYTVTDVVNKLGSRLNSLSEDCKLLGSDQDCSRCSQMWAEMSVESDVCRYAVLISVIGQRIRDEKWFESLYNCLGDQSLHQGNLLDKSPTKSYSNVCVHQLTLRAFCRYNLSCIFYK